MYFVFGFRPSNVVCQSVAEARLKVELAVLLPGSYASTITLTGWVVIMWKFANVPWGSTVTSLMHSCAHESSEGGGGIFSGRAVVTVSEESSSFLPGE